MWVIGALNLLFLKQRNYYHLLGIDFSIRHVHEAAGAGQLEKEPANGLACPVQRDLVADLEAQIRALEATLAELRQG
jgi:hypothetical protein